MTFSFSGFITISSSSTHHEPFFLLFLARGLQKTTKGNWG
jgi:hypothetical protein